MKSDRFIKQDPDMKNSNYINKILDKLLFFDYDSIKAVWNELNNQEETEKNMFLRFENLLDIISSLITKYPNL